MAASREDIYRSALAALTESPSMAGATILIQQIAQSTRTLNEWFEFSISGTNAQPGRTTHTVEAGAIRVACAWREGPTSDSENIGRLWALTDKVFAALRWRDIVVKDYASGSGANVVGVLACRETAIEDPGDAIDGVKSLVCVTEFVFSGAA